MRRLTFVLPLLLLSNVVGSVSAAEPAPAAVSPSCSVVIADASALAGLQRAGQKTKGVNLMPYLTKLRAGKPDDGEHRLFQTESGMTISVRLKEGRVAEYVVDRKATVEYSGLDDIDDDEIPQEAQAEVTNCGPGEALCAIIIEEEGSPPIMYFMCCPIIVLN